MWKGKDLERVAAVEERRVAAEARRVLEALAEGGAEGRVRTKEEKKEWRRMRVISKGSQSGHMLRSTTNSEGIL
jgi:hypothetical protein